jgi:NAD(P)-dependent dehydrogenase (short-subunit alcohol dehydrogenase family)
MDVENESSVRDEAERIARFPGRLDAVVSNAGLSVPRAKAATVLTLFPEDLEAMLRVNVVGAARIIRCFDPLVKDGGIFATITSEAGAISNAFPSMPGYAISKAAENKLVSIQHATVTRYRVLAVHPGRVDTDMNRESAQISAQVCADALADLLCGRKQWPEKEWFIDYHGEPMLC